VEHGHQVTVVSSYVTHAERTIPEQYKGKKIHAETSEDVMIYRTYASPNYSRAIWSRAWNYLTFMWYSILASLRVKEIDLVLASINPISVGWVGLLVSALKKTPFVLEVCDLSADGAESLGVLRNRVFLRLLRWAEYFLFKRATHVIVLSRGIGEGVKKAGVPESKITFIPMGVDVALPDVTARAGIRTKDSEFIVLFVGAYNTYSSLDTVLLAAEKLKSYSDIRFVFVGGGDQLGNMERLVHKHDLSNVTICDPRPKDEIPTIVAESNVCLVPYRNADILRGTLPNKVFDAFAVARPVVAPAPEGELTTLIRESGGGMCVAPENPQALADALLSLYQQPHTAKEMGEKGRQYMIQHYDRQQIMSNYLILLEDVNSSV